MLAIRARSAGVQLEVGALRAAGCSLAVLANEAACGGVVQPAGKFPVRGGSQGLHKDASLSLGEGECGLEGAGLKTRATANCLQRVSA